MCSHQCEDQNSDKHQRRQPKVHCPKDRHLSRRGGAQGRRALVCVYRCTSYFATPTTHAVGQPQIIRGAHPLAGYIGTQCHGHTCGLSPKSVEATRHFARTPTSGLVSRGLLSSRSASVPHLLARSTIDSSPTSSTRTQVGPMQTIYSCTCIILASYM